MVWVLCAPLMIGNNEFKVIPVPFMVIFHAEESHYCWKISLLDVGDDDIYMVILDIPSLKLT